MSNARAQAVLYESEAALRLVDQELHNLHALSRNEHCASSTDLANLPGIMERANAHVLTILSRLRESRVAPQRSTVGNLHVTHEQLRDVTSVLVEMEQRLMEMSKLFDMSGAPDAGSARGDMGHDAFDPNATTRDTDGRQALADEMFTASKAPVV